MVWSPRRLAELAGTSRRAVRHYHEIGLLPEPQRRSNGYQQYGVEHLVRLIRIRRLTELGLSLSQVAAVGDADRLPTGVLRDVEAEIARDIERLQRTRAELVTMLEQETPLDVPVRIAGRVEGLPTVERALVVVLSRLLGPRPLEAYLDLLPPYRSHAAVVAFDNLPGDADGSSREVVATGIAEHLRHLAAERLSQFQLVDAGLWGAGPGRRDVQEAVADLYNPAQLDVLTRALRLRRAHASGLSRA
ncbi:MerR family transcriptional regulator [Pseudonocardia nematodicida]|uniref:MerR family transcriptional regulator n=1 Tax=Pseudonocardia nematodicida TaxID=1206997 RepID=A0ABV1KES9_9PSEU